MVLNSGVIRNVLFEKSVTQKNFAKQIGIGHSTLAKVCNRYPCRYETAIKIANGLGIPLDDLIQKEQKGES